MPKAFAILCNDWLPPDGRDTPKPFGPLTRGQTVQFETVFEACFLTASCADAPPKTRVHACVDTPPRTCVSTSLWTRVSTSPETRAPTSLRTRVPASLRTRVSTSPETRAPTSLRTRVTASLRTRVSTSLETRASISGSPLFSFFYAVSPWSPIWSPRFYKGIIKLGTSQLLLVPNLVPNVLRGD